MRRYLFYDVRSGEVVHSHQAYVFGSDELAEPDEDTLSVILARVAEPDSLGWIVTDEQPVSSLHASWRVDPERRVLLKGEPDERLRAWRRADAGPPARGGR